MHYVFYIENFNDSPNDICRSGATCAIMTVQSLWQSAHLINSERYHGKWRYLVIIKLRSHFVAGIMILRCCNYSGGGGELKYGSSTWTNPLSYRSVPSHSDSIRKGGNFNVLTMSAHKQENINLPVNPAYRKLLRANARHSADKVKIDFLLRFHYGLPSS